ncbi:hypothetical protein EEL32_14755 [Brevibacillus laterosporus]|nr:hypothetical protein [Brevibacillus laterosporus]TPG85692.1 hypothetical protein EEL32_14755 [Brevibacillus laterosporus]
MFYHGIHDKYVVSHYPILSPRRTAPYKHGKDLSDRMHLIEQFGIEPIHLLEESCDYSQDICLRECRRFGNVVFSFQTLPIPLWQLSKHEIAVPILDLRETVAIYATEEHETIRRLFPSIPYLIK